ncbi:MAG: 3-deoxy-manno-octulosonate cytidylyltransferase [Longimicrobiales bacterium]
MAEIIAVIPARMNSSRFPGKPLARLLGRPMIEHVFRRTAACNELSDVLIATCDPEIARAVEGFGGRAVMTSPLHERATERVAEAVASRKGADIVVMVQGDEPMIQPGMISAALQPLLSEPQLGCVNLVSALKTLDDVHDPNTIKVVRARNGNALFFSRAPIPSPRNQPFVADQWWKQVCIIPFRRPSLERFAALPPTPLEVAESIDMLRLLEHGIAIRLVPTDIDTHAVDTPQDLAAVEALLARDPLSESYLAAR